MEYLYDSRQNFFYRFSLSDSFQIGMNVTEDFDILWECMQHCLSLRLLSAKHYFGVGNKNLGWDLSVNKYNIPVIGKYGVYSINLPNQKASYHFGLSEFKSNQRLLFYCRG